MNKPNLQESPCVSCSEYPDCRAMCVEWRKWFHWTWATLRNELLGVPMPDPEEEDYDGYE